MCTDKKVSNVQCISLSRHVIATLVPWRPLTRHRVHAGLLGLRLLCSDTGIHKIRP